MLSGIVPFIHYDPYTITTSNQISILQKINVYASAVRQNSKAICTQPMDIPITHNILLGNVGNLYIMGIWATITVSLPLFSFQALPENGLIVYIYKVLYLIYSKIIILRGFWMISYDIKEIIKVNTTKTMKSRLAS